MTLQAFIDQFIESLASRAYSPRTLQGYRNDLEGFLTFLKNQDRGTNLPGPSEIEPFLGSQQSPGKRVSPTYRNRRLSCLRSFFHFLIDQGFLASNEDPTSGIRFSRLPRLTPSFLLYEEYLALLGSLRTVQPEALRKRNHALLVLLYNTGLRLSELVALDVGQFNSEAGLLIGLHRKGGVVRDLPVNQNVVRSLRQWLEVRSLWNVRQESALFLTRGGTRVSPRMIQRLVSQCAKRAGLSKRVTPHTFRHSHCTEIQLRGASIAVAQQLLDHRSIQTTSRYSHAHDLSLRLAVATLDDPRTWEI